jgi:hypothetical protein
MNTNTRNLEKETSTSQGVMKSSELMILFEDKLMDIYWAEKALTKAIRK